MENNQIGLGKNLSEFQQSEMKKYEMMKLYIDYNKMVDDKINAIDKLILEKQIEIEIQNQYINSLKQEQQNIKSEKDRNCSWLHPSSYIDVKKEYENKIKKKSEFK